MRRASLAPESLYAFSSSSSPSPSLYCDEESVVLDDLLQVAATSSSSRPFKTAAMTSSSWAASAASRRRSLPVRAQRTAQSAIIGGQLPHRRRPSAVVRDEARLNSAQHPHVPSILDPKIQMDDRTLRNLKETERDSVLVGPHFLEAVQTELQAHHRATVVEWMHDVLREDAADEEVYPLAVLILDSFLSQQNILLRDVQGIASACMLMASKIKAPQPMTASRLSFFTENSVTSGQIVNWELLVLRALKWQIALPTAFDFADQVFCRVPSLRALRGHFVRALYDIQQNLKDAVLTPSVQAAVALSRAARACPLSPALSDQLRSALVTYLDFDMDLTPIRVLPPPAGACSTPPREDAASAAFDASSLAYTPFNDDVALLQPAAAAAAAAVAAAARPKSPPTTPPSGGADSGFCSTQGTPESLAEAAEARPPPSPFF